MNTPIVDFIKAYRTSAVTRLHMPGHKGKGTLGIEESDITEIAGADLLYAPDGIIKDSEDNCSSLFQSAHSFYSTEGSTLAIKAMLFLATVASGEDTPLVLAARNAHKAFVYAAAWLDFEIKWLMPQEKEHLCACFITKEEVEKAILASEKKPCALYLTSPDYLGNLADVEGIAAVCHKYGSPLLVDNAHGAYLAFLDQNKHPLALGADMTADSAHKTLPVLTSGAYLHIAQKANPYFVENARAALASFASTSPSYLTLASLDACNHYLFREGKTAYPQTAKRVDRLKKTLFEQGFSLVGNEPLKLTLYTPAIGFFAGELAEQLRKDKIECEFADKEYLVLMVSPQNTNEDFCRLENALQKAKKENRAPFSLPALGVLPLPPQAISVRKAILLPSETVPAKNAIGRIAALPTVSCPPAVPIAVSGEVITEDMLPHLMRYGIDTLAVVKDFNHKTIPQKGESV